MGLTCKNATRPDNAIVSPQLVPFVTEIGLLDDTWLATHRPVHFQITLPGQTLFMRHLRFPKSLVDLGMMDKDWDNLHDMTGSLAQATTIQEWGQAMEDNVNAALHQGKGNVDRMNRSFRGRCQPVRFVRCPVMSSTKKARNGCFEPSTEVLTIATRRKVTQAFCLEEELQPQFMRRSNLSQVHGPAAALAYLLDHINWKLDSQGRLHVTAFLAFPLLQISMHRITRFLQDAWTEKLILMLTARTKWFRYPDISRRETVSVLCKFPDPKRWLLTRELAGAFQTAAQKKHWVHGATGQCDFCQHDDSRVHRLLECPIGAEVRQSYQSEIDAWKLAESLMPEYPFVTIHPEWEAMTLVHFLQPKPVFGDAILTKVSTMLSANIDVHWFTDGSCQHPSDFHGRYASFAVVLDLCENDQQRCAVAAQSSDASSLTTTLQTACMSRCQGEQDILRAETAAILAIAENVGHGHVHSDSQTALHNVQLALKAATPVEFFACDHVDLLYRLWTVREHVHLVFHKVKSHQNLDTIQDPLQKYWALGNNFVDKVAQHACCHLETGFVTKMEQFHADIVQDKQDLERIFQLHLELQDVRARASANQDAGDKVVYLGRTGGGMVILSVGECHDRSLSAASKKRCTGGGRGPAERDIVIDNMLSGVTLALCLAGYCAGCCRCCSDNGGEIWPGAAQGAVGGHQTAVAKSFQRAAQSTVQRWSGRCPDCPGGFWPRCCARCCPSLCWRNLVQVLQKGAVQASAQGAVQGAAAKVLRRLLWVFWPRCCARCCGGCVQTVVANFGTRVAQGATQGAVAKTGKAAVQGCAEGAVGAVQTAVANLAKLLRRVLCQVLWVVCRLPWRSVGKMQDLCRGLRRVLYRLW
eukprot:s251_g28.t1